MSYRKEKNLKKTEIGLIPEGWEIDILNRYIHINGHIGWKVLKLEDICDISSSKRIYAKEYKPTGIPFYRGKEIIEKFNGRNIGTELFIKKERFNELKDKFGAPVKGDILLTSVGTLGVPYLVQNEKFYFKDGNLTWFKNFKGSYNEFIFLWLQSPHAKNQIDRKAIGSTQKALTIDVLKKFEINLPPIQEQKAIADILTCLDYKIELNNQINHTLEKTAQTLFEHWFIDFEFPDENNHNLPYKSSGGEMVDSELGKIPKEWKVLPLDQIADFINGLPLQNYRPKGIGYLPVIKIKELKEGINPKTEKADINLDSKYIINDGDIIFSWSGSLDVKIWCHGRGALNQHLFKVYPLEYPKWLVYFWLQRHLNEFKRIASEKVTTMGHIQKKHLSSAKITIPPDGVINKFNQIFESIFNKYVLNSIENRNIIETRDILLPKLMTGKIRVNIEDEISEDISNA